MPTCPKAYPTLCHINVTFKPYNTREVHCCVVALMRIGVIEVDHSRENLTLTASHTQLFAKTTLYKSFIEWQGVIYG